MHAAVTYFVEVHTSLVFQNLVLNISIFKQRFKMYLSESNNLVISKILQPS